MSGKASALFSKIDIRAALLAALTLVIQCVLYWLAQFITEAAGLQTHTLATALDSLIPFLPGFLVPYVGCFVHWALTYYIVYKTEDGFARLFTAAVVGYIICFIVYLAWPTTITRPADEAKGVWGFVYGVICASDAPLNLFPSMHCMVAYLCAASTLRCPNAGRLYKAFSCIMLALVCMATVFVKQHYALDVLGGILLGAAVWIMAGSGNVKMVSTHLYKALKMH